MAHNATSSQDQIRSSATRYRQNLIPSGFESTAHSVFRNNNNNNNNNNNHSRLIQNHRGRARSSSRRQDRNVNHVNIEQNSEQFKTTYNTYNKLVKYQNNNNHSDNEDEFKDNNNNNDNHHETIENLLICEVCHETIDDPITLCGCCHTFCMKDIIRWFSIRNSCPKCVSTIKFVIFSKGDGIKERLYEVFEHRQPSQSNSRNIDVLAESIPDNLTDREIYQAYKAYQKILRLLKAFQRLKKKREREQEESEYLTEIIRNCSLSLEEQLAKVDNELAAAYANLKKLKSE